MRIEICGGIASGKTTLACTLGQLTSVNVALEIFADNPFLEKFYTNPARYSFETEITFLLQHQSQIADSASKRLLVTDYSLGLDYAYALTTLSSADLPIFEAVVNRSIEKNGLPDLVVRLRCPIEVELDRITARNRPAEESIQKHYLESIEGSIDRALLHARFIGIPVLNVDSVINDFRSDGPERESVVATILEALRRATTVG